MIPHNRPVLFFDGECNLCNGIVQFIIKNDKKKLFLFAPLQSEAGKIALAGINTSLLTVNSVVLVYEGKAFTRSAAALATLKLLGGAWRLLYAGIVIPPFIRDALYDFVSRKRYKWFGKADSCMLPTRDLADRFLYK